MIVFRNVVRPFRSRNKSLIINQGRRNDCPFCAGRHLIKPTSGMEILFLNGSQAGWAGTVQSTDEELHPFGEFLVHFPHQPSNIQRRCIPNYDLFIENKILQTPGWLPKLSIESTHIVDELVIRLGAKLIHGDEHIWNDEFIASSTGSIWWERLPINGKDFWQVCHAHGFPTEFKSQIVSKFDFGIKLLVATNGRKPVQRKKQKKPMSVGRYLTKSTLKMATPVPPCGYDLFG